MKIGIVGPGAIGRLLGYFLASCGHEVLMICRREEQAEAFLQNGLTFVDLEGKELKVPVTADVGRSDRLAAVDGAIVTVKSYDTEAAAKLLAGLAVPVLSLQNGLGNAETLARFVSPARLSVALTTHGATAEGDTKVWYKGQGQTVIGDVEQGSETAKWWAERFAGSGHEMTLSADIRTEVWKKAMVNIGINPFTALLGVRNGRLLHEPDVLPLMQAAVEEAERVARAEGIEISGSFERVKEVCHMTADNISSMLQDLRKGRRTEIDALCGEIVTRGEKHGIAVRYNRLLKNLMKTCETKRFELSSLELRRLFQEILFAGNHCKSKS
jgi:2-dehydropantoate 2-reductase